MPSMTGLGRRAVRFAIVAAFLYFGVSLFAAWMLVRLAVHPERRPLDQAVSQHLAVSVENVSITAPDGAVLKAWFAQPDHPNGAAVILLHGVADNREGVLGFGSMFLRHGYAVLLPDSRAHGESGGALPT
jgi:dipeptidyl aminopeptidase/acylaminoacyl peptidase